MKKSLLIAITVLNCVPALARRGGEDAGTGAAARPETIRCGLYSPDAPTAQAEASALVENGAAVLRGAANGVSYLFSVRGKTAVAKLSLEASQQTVSAQGAIEMLRHGGRRDGAARFDLVRRGNDDAQDGNPEKEAGFELAISNPSSNGNVKLKCLSTNEVKK